MSPGEVSSSGSPAPAITSPQLCSIVWAKREGVFVVETGVGVPWLR